ncbi:MAG: NAD(P)/FAD-dependent oxidoreductase [Ramlibacter sp.]|nr:NAD(P)/FAD-dependent oxidoreductase [Ramlibacter sp.]
MEQLDVAILGAGLGGLGAAIRLQRAGIGSFRVLERAQEVGGTWRDNTYPGCACDIPSHLYSFSFEPNTEWTRPYPRQAEIQAYILRTVARHQLAARIQLGAQVTQLRWLADEQLWRIDIAGEPALKARHVISATGPLNKPAIPAIEGRGSFAGEQFHSSQWRHDVPLAGRRVAVVGTGASAIQIVPALAGVAAQLSVFQRTPPWVVPRPDRPYSAVRRQVYRALPWLQTLNRWRIYWRNELFGLGFLGSQRMQRLARWGASAHLRHQVRDPALRERLTPDYAPGCKRMGVSSDYYPALQKPGVALVTGAIDRVEPRGIVTADGALHECDVIVWATGFTATEFVTPMRIHGEGGVELSALWQAQPAATHLGIHVAGFPNLHLLVGPSTGLGHNSIVFMIEAQLNTIIGALRGGPPVLRLKPQVQAASYAGVQRRLRRTVWASGCKSWYQHPDGRIDTLWPGFTWQYWRATRRFDARLYEISET